MKSEQAEIGVRCPFACGYDALLAETYNFKFAEIERKSLATSSLSEKKELSNFRLIAVPIRIYLMENIKTFSFFFDEDAEGFIFEWKNPFDIPSRLPHCNSKYHKACQSYVW
jgi:hypothetical protein